MLNYSQRSVLDKYVTRKKFSHLGGHADRIEGLLWIIDNKHSLVLSQQTSRLVTQTECSACSSGWETLLVDSCWTIQGPLLFLLHINELPKSVSLQVRLFTDDCWYTNFESNQISPRPNQFPKRPRWTTNMCWQMGGWRSMPQNVKSWESTDLQNHLKYSIH